MPVADSIVVALVESCSAKLTDMHLSNLVECQWNFASLWTHLDTGSWQGLSGAWLMVIGDQKKLSTPAHVDLGTFKSNILRLRGSLPGTNG